MGNFCKVKKQPKLLSLTTKVSSHSKCIVFTNFISCHTKELSSQESKADLAENLGENFSTRWSQAEISVRNSPAGPKLGELGEKVAGSLSLGTRQA